MQKLRNAIANVLVGLVVVLGALWLLRGVFRMVYWMATLIVLVLAIGVVLRVASKIRGK